jgi:hypothetical protein
MTIRKGEAWGSVVAPPAGLPIFDDERVAAQGLKGFVGPERPIALGLRGGDLARTMGGGGSGRFDGEVVCAPVDLLRVALDGESFCAAAHVVLRRRWWRGRVVLAMNAQYLGRFDVAPRSHPNDGRVDVLDIDPSMGLRARLQARARARTGSHLPHPHIRTSSVATCEFVFDRPLNCWIDGALVRTARRVTINVEPDALLVHA